MIYGTLVDFVENVIGEDSGSIALLARHRPAVLVRRREEMLRFLADSWVGHELKDQRQREGEGELWPVLPVSAPNIIDLARSTTKLDIWFGSTSRAAEQS